MKRLTFFLSLSLISSLYLLYSLDRENVIAFHEHEVKSEINYSEYENDIKDILQNFKIPGLLYSFFLKGFKGERSQKYAIIWIFKNKEAIEENFGTFENPRWPQEWLHYENDVLAKYLICHPDAINFTDYCIINLLEYERSNLK